MKLSFTKIFYPLASCIFIGVLLLPLTDEFFNYLPRPVNQEQRTWAKMPKFKKDSATFFPKEFESFYKDNFGFRQDLINLAAKIKCAIFYSSPVPGKVSLGKNDWLFLTGRDYDITQDLTRQNLIPTEDSLRKYVEVWENREKELNARNIKYYKAFWPDKHYIYPEFMPLGMRCTDRDTLHKCDQVIHYLKRTNSPIEIIDVRAELLEAKKKYKIYHKYDSHWNSYGAFIAYTKLIRTLSLDFPAIKPFTASDFTIDWNVKGELDLATLINMDWSETQPVFSPKNNEFVIAKISSDGFPKKTIIHVNDSATTQLTALVYRDSFTSALIPYLMLHFKKVVFIWDYNYSIEMVEQVKPDIVIECYASRYFR